VSKELLEQEGITRRVWRRGAESNRRIKVLQTSALPLGYRALSDALPFRLTHSSQTKNPAWTRGDWTKSGAGDGSRTRDFDLGKVALYH
jgi:hypothetical protein